MEFPSSILWEEKSTSEKFIKLKQEHNYASEIDRGK